MGQMQSSLPCTNMKLVIVPLLTLLSAVLGREIGSDISSICADGGFDSLADCVDFIVENRLFTYDFGTNTDKDDTRPSLPLELQPPPIRGEIRTKRESEGDSADAEAEAEAEAEAQADNEIKEAARRKKRESDEDSADAEAEAEAESEAEAEAEAQ